MSQTLICWIPQPQPPPRAKQAMLIATISGNPFDPNLLWERWLGLKRLGQHSLTLSLIPLATQRTESHWLLADPHTDIQSGVHL